MSTPLGFGPVVIQLDLRSGAAELDTAPALRARVARQLGRAGLPEPDDPLFLVTDTPAGLTDHQRQYELLTAYRAVGDVRILVLLVGSAPGSYAGQDEAYRPDRRLLRPAVLRTDRTAILWAGDLRSARTALEQPAPDDPDALAVLVDVLSVPDVYLRVLSDLEALPDAVAAPGVRLLEQDLPRRCATGPGVTRSPGSRATTPNSRRRQPSRPAPICQTRYGRWSRAGAAGTSSTGSRAARRTTPTAPAPTPSTTPSRPWPASAPSPASSAPPAAPSSRPTSTKPAAPSTPIATSSAGPCAPAPAPPPKQRPNSPTWASGYPQPRACATASARASANTPKNSSPRASRSAQ